MGELCKAELIKYLDAKKIIRPVTFLRIRQWKQWSTIGHVQGKTSILNIMNRLGTADTDLRQMEFSISSTKQNGLKKRKFCLLTHL
jgi:hypothetical protein